MPTAAHPVLAQSSGYITTSDSARLYYRVAGTGRDTLIAMHGGPGMDMESIYGDFAPLTANHVVIFYDQRGGGRSELPSDTTRLVVERQVQDLDELRQHFGLRRVTLLAHSYGPLLAASYAIAHSDAVRAMVFFGPLPPYQGDFWARYGAGLNARLDDAQRTEMSRASRVMNDTAASDAVSRQGCRDFWAVGLRPRLADPDRTTIKSAVCDGSVAGFRYGLTTGNRVIMASYGNWDLRPALRTLDVPLLVVHGEAEVIPMEMVESWVTGRANASLLRVPRAAHFPYTERPELVWPAVERFLAAPESWRP
jgi:proline iminopeptidase